MRRSFKQPVAGLILAAALLGSLVLLAAAVQNRWAPVETLDRSVSQALQDAVGAQPWLVSVMQVVSDLGGLVTWWTVHTVTVVALLILRRFPDALFVAVTAGGGGALTTAVKFGVGRARPEWSEPVSWAEGFAFPSGHTTGTAIGVTVLLVILRPQLSAGWRWGLASFGVVMVIAVGASRVVLGVHWVSDVLGGLLFAAAWVLIMLAVFRKPEGADHDGGEAQPRAD